MSDPQLTGADPSLATQTIFTNDSRVACNGGDGALGHPQVWLTLGGCLLYTSPSPRDKRQSRMPSSA